MKILTYSLKSGRGRRVGFLHNGWVVDVLRAAIWVKENRDGLDEYLQIPTTMMGILSDWNRTFFRLQKLAEELARHDVSRLRVNSYSVATRESEIIFYSPVPTPPTFRNFNTFEQHVKTVLKQQGFKIHPLWYQVPTFYFSNTNSLHAHREDVSKPQGTEALDFGLELGIFIANGGRDIQEHEADNYIAGYTIINDWSARDFQKEEMNLNLGVAKGKDFATSVGPYLVTPDEFENNWEGGKLHLTMKAYRNGKQISAGKTSEMVHSWGKMIERASANTHLLPGDLIGSGTVGTGCIMELRPENVGGWLQKGDIIRLEIEKLGVLENTIV